MTVTAHKHALQEHAICHVSLLDLCTFFTLCLPTRHDCVPHTSTPSTPPYHHTCTTHSHHHTCTTPSYQHTYTTPSHQHTCTTPSHQHTCTTPSHQHTCTAPSHQHTYLHNTLTLPHLHSTLTPPHLYSTLTPPHQHISLTLPHPLVLQFTLASSVGSDVTYQCLVNSRHLMHNPFMSEHMHMHSQPPSLQDDSLLKGRIQLLETPANATLITENSQVCTMCAHSDMRCILSKHNH